MISEIDGRTYYSPGEVVRLRHSKLSNIPNMYVVEKVTRTIFSKEDNSSDTAFIGIKCRWFDNNSCLREAIFSTKDLVHVE